MPYTFGATNWYDPLVTAVNPLLQQAQSGLTSAASSAASSAATGAAPALKSALVQAVREVLPDLKKTLSAGLSDGAKAIVTKNQIAFLGIGLTIGVFAFGTLGLLYAQSNKLGRCCPVRA